MDDEVFDIENVYEPEYGPEPCPRCGKMVEYGKSCEPCMRELLAEAREAEALARYADDQRRKELKRKQGRSR